MSVVSALCDCSALLLLASGPAKLRDPGPTATMIGELRLPGWRRLPQRPLVRIVGAAEIAVAGYVLAVGDRVSVLLLAAAYLAFTVVALRLLLSASTADCGCFGAASAPISRAHVAVTAAGWGCATAGSIAGAGPVSDLFTHGAGLGAVAVALVVTLAGAAYLTITALPALVRARTT